MIPIFSLLRLGVSAGRLLTEKDGRSSEDPHGMGAMKQDMSGAGVVRHAVALTRPIGSSMPWRRQNSDDQAPPASSTDCVRMIPFSVTTALTRPPWVSSPRAAQS